MLKNQVLELLMQGKVVSGQEMAQLLGVTRSAIWKVIKQLKEDGYQIDGVTNKGYTLKKETEKLSRQCIESFLKHEFYVHIYDEVTSTNDIAKMLANEGSKENTVIISESQTQGRGRLQRQFYSPTQSGIYMSFILRPIFHMSYTSMITIIAAVACCEAIERLYGICPQIKWVNDIFYRNKKVGGILTEASISIETGHLDDIIVGIGLNLVPSQDGWPQELDGLVGSIDENQGLLMKRNECIALILNHFMNYYQHIEDKKYILEYKKRLFILGKTVYIIKNGEKKLAQVLDLDDECQLVVKYTDGYIEYLKSGEVSIRL